MKVWKTDRNAPKRSTSVTEGADEGSAYSHLAADPPVTPTQPELTCLRLTLQLRADLYLEACFLLC
jgi:hypothetical protein